MMWFLTISVILSLVKFLQLWRWKVSELRTEWNHSIKASLVSTEYAFFDHNKTLLFLVYQNSTRVFSCVSFYGCSAFNRWPIWWTKRKTTPTACSPRKPSTPNLRWTNQKIFPTTQPQVRQLFENYPGVILTVSHDVNYLRQVCQKIYRLDSLGLEEVEI